MVNKTCPDCGKPIFAHAKRCPDCARKVKNLRDVETRRQRRERGNAPRVVICPDCGKIIDSPASNQIRCKDCAVAYRRLQQRDSKRRQRGTIVEETRICRKCGREFRVHSLMERLCEECRGRRPDPVIHDLSELT